MCATEQEVEPAKFGKATIPVERVQRNAGTLGDDPTTMLPSPLTATGRTLTPKPVKRGMSHAPPTHRPNPPPQEALSGATGFEQVPFVVLQVPARRQAAGAGHMTGAAPTQAPLWHESVWVHMLLSLQGVPFGAGAHAPVAIEQAEQPPQAAPTFCHAPLASQVWGWEPLQVFAPGMHDPVQTPLAALQMLGQGAPAFCQTPLASQVWG
jgi:hypothetical protein